MKVAGHDTRMEQVTPPPPLSWLAIVLRKQKVRGSNPGATDGRGWSGIRSISLKPRIVEV